MRATQLRAPTNDSGARHNLHTQALQEREAFQNQLPRFDDGILHDLVESGPAGRLGGRVRLARRGVDKGHRQPVSLPVRRLLRLISDPFRLFERALGRLLFVRVVEQ